MAKNVCINFYETLAKRYGDALFFIFRVLIGAMYMGHGGVKIFGWLGANAFPLASFMGVVGLLEFLGGLAILLGIFTRSAALINVVIMLGAFFQVHFPMGCNPLSNGGELALLYFAAFLVLLAKGPGKWNLGEKVFKKAYY